MIQRGRLTDNKEYKAHVYIAVIVIVEHEGDSLETYLDSDGIKSQT